MDYQAVVSAGFTGDSATLLDAMDAPDPVVRALALGGLDRIGQLTDGHLLRAVADPDRDVRGRAVELAVTRPSIDLVPLLEDADDLVVETAAWALGERGSDDGVVVGALVAVVRSHEVSICREAAVAALGAIGSEAGLPAILAALEDRAPVRRRAVLALAPFDGPEVEQALRRALSDRDRQVRQAAEDLI